MKKLLKIEDRRRSCSIGTRPRLTRGLVLLSVLLGSVLTLPATADEPQPPTNRPGILIVPRQLAYATEVAPKNKPRVNKTGIVIAPVGGHATYAGAYGSIPFSRAEFEANPSYRHEAAMEILFGKLRPMVVHKYTPQTKPPQFLFDNYGSYPFGSSLRNYNFYYPRPTIYRHY